MRNFPHPMCWPYVGPATIHRITEGQSEMGLMSILQAPIGFQRNMATFTSKHT